MKELSGGLVSSAPSSTGCRVLASSTDDLVTLLLPLAILLVTSPSESTSDGFEGAVCFKEARLKNVKMIASSLF